MKKGKHEKQEFKKIEAYSVLIFIATLLMCIGYARISERVLNIEGKVTAVAQEGVFITDVEYISSNEADTSNSKINYYIETVLDSQITLGNNINSYITYEITLYNSTNKEQLFIDTFVDNTIPNSYTNENIEFYLEGIEEGITTILPKESLTFSITFKYKENANTANGILKSMLNFRFLEKPILVLSNENETYTLKDIYPDYTPAEYQFILSNYGDNGINNIPMTYYFETQIDSPLTAKIYDENGTEVKDSISIEGDGSTKVDHTYTLKIIWDNSKTEENVYYNSFEHANKNLNCIVNLKVTPSGENSQKYSGYTLDKQFNVGIKTAALNFEASASNTKIEYRGESAEQNIIIKNNNGSNYNLFDTKYEITIKDNEKFTITQNNNGNIEGNKLTNKTEAITFTKKGNNLLENTENLTVIVKSTSPYVKEIEIPITIEIMENWDITCYGMSSYDIIRSNEGKTAEINVTGVEEQFEKINLPLNNLEVGAYYQLTFTNSMTGTMITGTSGRNLVYGCTVMPTKATNYTDKSYIIARSGNNSGFLWKTLNGNEKTATITFKATAETMYWIWDLSRSTDNTESTFTLKDISIEKTPLPSNPYVDFPNTTIYQEDNSSSLVYSQRTFVTKASYEDLVLKIQTVGGIEFINIPIKGLTIDKTYTLSFDNYTPADQSTQWKYGCRVRKTKRETGSTLITNSDYIIKDMSIVNSGTITFTATAETMYWVWECAGIADGQWATINISNVTLTEQNDV